MGSSNILILVNQVRFFPDKFGDDTIKRSSKIVNQQIEKAKPVWLRSTIQQAEL